MLISSLLKSYISFPRIFFWLPGHPLFKNRSSTYVIADHFFHVGILVPKLVNSRQMLASSVPNISCVLYMFVFHFHLSILEPQGNMLIVDFHRPLKYRSCSGKLHYTCLPLGVFYPSTHSVALHTKFFLEFFALHEFVVLQLILVHYV